MYFEKIPHENRPEASCITQPQNVPSYDVTDKLDRGCPHGTNNPRGDKFSRYQNLQEQEKV